MAHVMSVEDDKRLFEDLDKEEEDVSKRRWHFAKRAFGRWIGVTVASWFSGILLFLVGMALLGATGIIKESDIPLIVDFAIPTIAILGFIIGFISAVRWTNRATNALIARDAEKAELASAGRIKVRLPNGRIGTVAETDFDADIMERL